MLDLTEIPSISIEKYKVDFDPLISVFRVTLKTSKGLWPETFGSKAELQIFLVGVRASFGIMGIPIKIPEIPSESSGTFILPEVPF